jgi:hypothetical protein
MISTSLSQGKLATFALDSVVSDFMTPNRNNLNKNIIPLFSLPDWCKSAREAVERVFRRLKNLTSLTRHNLRGLAKVTFHSQLCILSSFSGLK